MESSWTDIPNISVLIQYFRAKHSEAPSVGKYRKNSRVNMFEKKFTKTQDKQMMINVLKETGTGSITKLFRAVGAQLSFLLGHHCFFSGDNRKFLEITDSLYEEEETSHGTVPILDFQFTRGKTTNVKKLLGVCRNEDVEMCLVSAFAFSLWFRFDFGEHQPKCSANNNALNFLDDRSQSDPKVIFSTSLQSLNENEAISNAHMKKISKMCFESIGLDTKTHRHAGKKQTLANTFDIDEAQIRSSGKWKLDLSQFQYVSSCAYDFIHHLAGFKPEEPYFISRDIPVPESLQQQIFPWLENELEKARNRAYQEGFNMVAQDSTVPRFLGMLKKFSSVILQDLALLSELVPESVNAQHPITSTQEFLQFREELKKAMKSSTISNNTPEKQEALSTISPVITNAIGELKTEFGVLIQNNRATNALMKKTLEMQEKMAKTHADDMEYIKSQLLTIYYNQTLLANISIKKSDIEKINKRMDKLEGMLKSLNKRLKFSMECQGILFEPSPVKKSKTVPTPESSSRESTSELAEKTSKIRKRQKVDDSQFNTPEYNLLPPESIPDAVKQFHGPIAAFEKEFKSKWRKGSLRETIQKKSCTMMKLIGEVMEQTKLNEDEAAALVEAYRIKEGFGVNTIMSQFRNKTRYDYVLKKVVKLWKKAQDVA